MESYLPENEYKEFEGRVYANPQVSVDETNTFIDKLRSAQGNQNQEIFQQTQRLGTDVPSNLGGLLGGNGYFTSRSQTPQTNSSIANLRSTAQASAMNQALANEEAMWKKRYQDAYRAYQKRSWNNQNNNNTDTATDGDVNTEDTTIEISDVSTEALAKSRYQKILMKYLQAGYPLSEAENRAKEDFGKSIDVDSPVAPYQGGQ